MGFRDLSSFNVSMLGKQVWRIIQNLNCLLSRVLKAKYFPHCDVLDASLCANASFTWKSIFSSIELVKYGMVWHIGSGDQIDVWLDNWIPRHSFRRPFTPNFLGVENFSVANFVNPNSFGWDIDAIREVLWECDVADILQIPVGGQGVDRRRWFYSSNGYYSVKSAYHAARELKKQ